MGTFWPKETYHHIKRCFNITFVPSKYHEGDRVLEWDNVQGEGAFGSLVSDPPIVNWRVSNG